MKKKFFLAAFVAVFASCTDQTLETISPVSTTPDAATSSPSKVISNGYWSTDGADKYLFVDNNGIGNYTSSIRPNLSVGGTTRRLHTWVDVSNPKTFGFKAWLPSQGYGVVGYPHYQCDYNIKYSRISKFDGNMHVTIPSFLSEYGWPWGNSYQQSISQTLQTFNNSYDMFFGLKPSPLRGGVNEVNVHRFEVMIWLSWDGKNGAMGERIRSNVTLGGADWNIYKLQNPGNNCDYTISYVRTHRTTQTYLNFKSMIDYLGNSGIASDIKSCYLKSFSFGFELTAANRTKNSDDLTEFKVNDHNEWISLY